MPERWQRWLFHARADRDAARVLMAEEIYNLACLHAHQCVEKLLKGSLLRNIGSYPKSHDLVELINKAAISEGEFASWREDILVLNQYYTAVRYPDVLPGATLEGLPDQQEAREALELAEKFFRFAEGHLSANNPS